MTYKINIPPDVTIHQWQYRIPHAYQPLVAEQMQRLLDAGVIRPSTSRFNSPMVIIRKKTMDGSLQIRCCLDLRKVNQVIKTTVYPMPHIEDILDQLASAHFITVLDLKDTYSNIELDDESKAVTAFTIPSVGHMEYCHIPFGLKDTVSLFNS